MSSPVVIPNVGTLTSSALTTEAVQELWQNLVCQMLGIVTDPMDPNFDELCYSKVRTEFPPDGQPAWEKSDDVAFVAAIETPVHYDQIRDRSISPTEGDGAKYTQTDQYTRGWELQICLYGPNASARMQTIVSCLSFDFVFDTLSAQNLYLLPDFQRPRRVPELFAKQWWESVDLRLTLYEGIAETIDLPSIASVEVEIAPADGPTVTLEILTSGYGGRGYGDGEYGL